MTHFVEKINKTTNKMNTLLIIFLVFEVIYQIFLISRFYL